MDEDEDEDEDENDDDLDHDGVGAGTDADACDNDTQLGADDSGSPRRLVSRVLTIMMTAAMSMAMLGK
jgi:hypothetical protein